MRLPLLLLSLLAPPAFAADRPDVLVADFEGDTYGDGWTTTGTAFGTGPAKGTLPGQMPVSGSLGKGLVNSFRGGDDSTGTLTSPEFAVARKYLNFLVGGGKHPGKTCVNLLVGGEVVRTATGPNDRPGGSERLEWHTWDVAEFEGKKAAIQIVDEQKGGWGHINVDHIVQSDTKKQAEPQTATLDVSKPFLHLPVKTGAPVRRVKFLVSGETVREFDIELALDGKPDFHATADVSAFAGKKLTAEATLPADAKLAGLVVPADAWADADKLYREKHRPLFHFTSRTGWLNDPNGLVYADGTWHLFYQHNPFGREWGNMHWGHATSTDLFRWKEEGIALYPKKYGDWAFSGSAVLDKGNTSGFGTKDKPPLVLAYTSTGRGECIAHSTDGGKTWTEYDKNPVVKHAGRDPKLLWHAKAKHWVMAVYDEHDKKQWIAFYTSPDLKAWTFASRIEGFYECPDLFPLPARTELGAPKDYKWVLHAADGKYLVGQFDGEVFLPEHRRKKQLWYGRFYAAQSFDVGSWFAIGSGPPAAFLPPRVQIGWAQGVTFPGTPFNQQMTVPVRLGLTDDGDGAVLTAWPVSGIESLREKGPVEAVRRPGKKFPAAEDGKEARHPMADDLDAFELTAELDPGSAATLGFDLRGTKLVYDAAKKTLTCKDVTAPVQLRDGKLTLRVLVDRGSVEVFADGGRVAMSVAALPGEKNRRVELFATGGGFGATEVTVYRLKSAWEK